MKHENHKIQKSPRIQMLLCAKMTDCNRKNSQLSTFNSQLSGMTLVEVLLAMMILGICIFGLMTGIGKCVEVFRASAFIQEAETAFNMGESQHPLIIENDPMSDLDVSPDEVFKGWTYERSVEESGEEDDLYIITTTVKKDRGGPGKEQEYKRLVYYKK